MSNDKHIVRYTYHDNKIKFPSKIGSAIIPSFCAAVNEWQRRRKYEPVTLDFNGVQNPYSNGMLGIISMVTDLKRRNNDFKIILPNTAFVSKLFHDKNWAYYLDPLRFKRSEAIYNKHMIVKKFDNFRDLPHIVKDFMDIVLGNMKIPKDIFSALEWSVHELCDNVINHSESSIGGFAEVVTFTKQDMISFTVADSGKGILKSLKEGIPDLVTDAQAIGEAIKAGVTRNKSVGQGNGLAGSLRITTMTGGSMEIISGSCRFVTTGQDSHINEVEPPYRYNGTIVSGVIKMNKMFSISKALEFGGSVPYKAVDLIDMEYEMQDKDCCKINMSSETTGYGTRSAGKQLRIKTVNLIESKPGYPIIVDWEGIPVISSSFADEYMGKLFAELGPITFSSIIRNSNMEPLIKGLLDKAITQRIVQSQE